MNASRRAIAMAACTGMVALHLTFPMMVALAETQVRKTDVAEVFCGVGSIGKLVLPLDTTVKASTRTWIKA
jgi:hypothetical protein